MELDPFTGFKCHKVHSNETGTLRRLVIFFDFIVLPQVKLNEGCKIFIKDSQEIATYPLNTTFQFVYIKKKD
jgi:hypothetical protein